MDIPIHAAVQCIDGPGGHVTYIVLNPVTRKVTDVVVRELGLLGAEVIVPVEFIIESTPETVNLRLARQELAGMQSFISTRFISPSDDFPDHYHVWADYPLSGAMLSPYAMMGGEGNMISYQAIPLNELAMSRGDRVVATDRDVGRIDEFLVNPETMGITHLVMREGHLWGQKDVTIPVSQIARISDGTVYLRLSKQQIQELPTLKVRRQGW
ncbi:MAG: hypothetical protein QOD83_4981 [Solirubrobacteraceae bacterium]|jgi:sporulation protein YlmC with PRC-barrel domain|nr:hypothetical protein [Solirubrobacteraceae bacterium]